MDPERSHQELDAQHDFRLFLQGELARRCARNNQYSLRAFADYLGVDHSSLSQMLRGKRRITVATIRDFCSKLGVEPGAATAYEARATMNPRELPGEIHGAIVQLAQDAAALMTEWTGFAILELVHCKDFRADCRWIAGVLDVTADEVNIALQRLLRLGLLEMSSTLQWRDLSRDNAATPINLPLITLRKLLERVQAGSSAISKNLDTNQDR